MNVKIARIKLGKTQKQICNEIRMSPKKLVEIEKGNYDILTLANMKAIAAALDTVIQTLFFSEEQ
jgi:putative transcriptional regulator